MSKYKKAFLDFYAEHKISPVSQDISDIQAHYARREALYRHLGVIPSFVKGKKVLEFGPGSGHNALYTASLGPNRYVLVDGNPTGLEETRKRLAHCDTEIVVTESLIESFETDEKFDIVMCEGVLPWQTEPQALLKKVASFVASGGVLLISCNNEASQLSEILRKLQARLIVSKEAPLAEQVEKLLPVFKADLESLAGMSRPHEDWLIDQILQPFIGECLSIGDSIIALDNDFDVYCTSPHFLLDWSWYKEVPIREKTTNQVGLQSFQQNIHNFIDYRFSFPPRPVEDNMKIDSLVSDILADVLGYEQTEENSHVESIQKTLEALVAEVEPFSHQTAESLADFANGVKTYRETGNFPTLTTFAPLFGRGQQYVSFIRR
ncbi:class I SAM-dependent methyltransferase [uncultured Pseudodesulfovibrio sp.]|uniref:class I SAM-dependent methyltransferase n=1 Tax=uncultured Pseudodesulfovibrio sp. TaxID=2035858 RepID=UPI0029C7D5D7|nr:class I SAM-dependent methyltransferase [uncultured Pseudodesulfovibrio sp.]